jgi:HCOMODA/2-hydroxy-3-carboxy-muconic semialdehyde decarboxylase
MIRPMCAAAAGLLCWLSFAAAQTMPTTAGPAPAAAVEELVLANRILNDRGVLDAYGHVSIRHPADPNRYLMARAIAPGLVTAEDIMEFDLDSNPVDRRGRSLFVERFIHGEAYKARPDVNAVIHTHSAGVIPFSVTQTLLRPVIHNASFLHVGVPVWEIRDAGGTTNMLVRDGKLGQSLAAAMSWSGRMSGSRPRAPYSPTRMPACRRSRSRSGDRSITSRPVRARCATGIPATRRAPGTCGRRT